MSLEFNLISEVAAGCLDIPKTARIFVAYSGGLDSTVLCDILCQLYPERVMQKTLIALHVHHGLQADADHFARHTAQGAKKWGIDYRAFHVAVKVPSGESLEACARSARYQVLSSVLCDQDVLMLGHHLDDQAETFLLQALRGAGVAGLACMPKIDSERRFYRPLLGVSKIDLMSFAEARGLMWIDDITNRDLSLDRNFLRQEILPKLRHRFPAVAKTLSRAAQNCADNLALMKLQRPVQKAATFADPGYPSFDLHLLSIQSPLEGKQLLKAWLDEWRCLISRVQLEQLWNCVVWSRHDSTPVLRLATGIIHRFDHRLFLLPQNTTQYAPYEIPWDGKIPLEVVGGAWMLTRDVLSQQGVEVESLNWSKVFVHSRRGGERCHPIGRAHSQTLKKLLQEYRVPPWRRDCWPIVSEGERIVCLPFLFVCQ